MDTNMENINMPMPSRRAALLALLSLTAAASSMHALPARADMVKSKPPAAAPLQQSYTWQDGKRQHTVWLDPQWLAEFNAGKKPAAGKSGAAAATVKAINTRARAVGKPKGGAQLWHMGEGPTSEQTAQSLMAKSAANSVSAGYSPVFRDGASSAGRMRALPGNVIVHLDPAWDRAAVDAWALNKQLPIVSKLPLAGNVYVLKTPPGLASLTTANALLQAGDVISAMPNWWQEVVTK